MGNFEPTMMPVARFQDFIAARRELLAADINEVLDSLDVLPAHPAQPTGGILHGT